MSDNDPSWPTDGADDQPATPPPPPPAASTPPPPPPAAAPAATANGSVGVRFGARFLDALILLIPNFVVGFMIGSAFVAGVVAVLINLAYFVWFETNQGQTLGKKILNLSVVGADGGMPTTEESLKRNVWMAFGIVPLLGDLASLAAAIAIGVTISTDDDNRGLHDTFAGTAVPLSR